VFCNCRVIHLLKRRLSERIASMAVLAAIVLGVLLLPRVALAGDEPLLLDVPNAPPAYYYPPTTKKQRPVVMYLHGRGANAQEDCRKWARVARQFGWVVCPQGGEDRGGGSRAWSNSAESGKQITDAVLAALKAKYKGRVQTRNNILIGFSEGAFIAQQVGLQDTQKWSKWLILAASDKYWVGDTKKTLTSARAKLHRVYLLTGEHDGVVENTKKVGEMLSEARVPVKVRIVSNMGHEVPSDKMIATYRRPLLWLSSTGKK
jgi:predicted esterase